MAEIRLSSEIRQGGVSQDGKGEVVTGIVMMLRGGNGREVIQQIEEKDYYYQQKFTEGVTIEKFTTNRI